jgi:hypothetical protein
MSKQRGTERFVKRFLIWISWAGAIIVVSQLLLALTLPSRSLAETLSNLGRLRTWGLVGIPIMIGIGLVMTTLDTMGVLQRDRWPWEKRKRQV